MVLLILGGLFLICCIIGFVVCFCVLIFSKREQNAALEAEKEKTNRILKVEEQKTERARLSAEKTALYARRDIANAEIEAAVLGGRREEESSESDGFDLGSLASIVLPILQRNPEILGSFLGRGNNSSSESPVPEQGVEELPSFPTSTV